MQVVPVIDVMNGVVVHAAGGERAHYRPIETPLAPGTSDPIAVARGLLRLYPFDMLYVADLDGIVERRSNLAVIAELADALPEVELWVDNGAAAHFGVNNLLGIRGVRAVVGTETLAQVDELERLAARFGDRLVLSLDFSGDAYTGPKRVLQDPRYWPPSVIVMSLGHVGANQGPDIARVGEIAARAGSRKVMGAGGVRDKADLMALSHAGAWGALVATALHSGTLKAGDLEEIAGLR